MHATLRPGPGTPIELDVIGAELVAHEAGEVLPGRAGALFRVGDGFVFVDFDHARNGHFIDVAHGATIDELERKLRTRAAAGSHPSADFDQSDGLVFERAREAMADA